MSGLKPKPKLAAIIGNVALLALLGISSDAQAARKKPVVHGSVLQSNSVRSFYGYQPPSSYDYQPSGTYDRRAPGTGILGGGASAGSGGPP